MFFRVLLCALATLAAKGDMVFTSIFMGNNSRFKFNFIVPRMEHLSWAFTHAAAVK